MVILDTDLIIAYFRNVPKAVRVINKFRNEKKELKTTVINIGELYKGAYLSNKFEENNKKIDDFLKSILILDLKIEDIKLYGKISAKLKQKGEIIGDLDELIASITISRDETLITRNVRHYERITQLSFQNWEEL